MRIAIPVWEEKVSPVLDTASRLLIVEIQDNREVCRFELHFEDQDIGRRCIRVTSLNIDTLICGAISRSFLRMLLASGVQVLSGRSGQIKAILNAYFQGRLADSKFLLPGYEEKNG